MPTVEQILSAESFDPTFALRPTAAAPTPSDGNFTRGSKAWSLDANRDIVEKVSGEPRIFGPNQHLRLEPQRTQQLGDPGDFTLASWGAPANGSTVQNAGTAKGKPYHEFVEDNDTSNAHYIKQGFSGGTDQDMAFSGIVRARGRNWIVIVLQFSVSGDVAFFFDLANAATGSFTEGVSGTLRQHDIDDLGDGWRWIKGAYSPPTGEEISSFILQTSNADVTRSYDGDGSSGFDFLYGGAEIGDAIDSGRMVTTPILDGGATRNRDDLDVPLNVNDEEFTVVMEWIINSTEFDDLPNLINFDGRNGIYYSNTALPTSLEVSSGGQSDNQIQNKGRQRIAVSLTKDEAKIGLNGTVTTNNYNGGALSASTINFSDFVRQAQDIVSFGYKPKALSTLDLETLSKVI